MCWAGRSLRISGSFELEAASSPAWSFRSAAASTTPAATRGSDVVFAIFSSAAAASRAWKRLLITVHRTPLPSTARNQNPLISFRYRMYKNAQFA